MNRAAAAIFRVGQAVMTKRTLPLVVSNNRSFAHKLDETPEEFDERWLKFFQRPDMDEWWLRKGMTDFYHEDCMPEPKIMIEAFKACRKINDFAAAVRFLEMMKEKCGWRTKEVWPWVMQEIQPTLNELGISTPDEMGYDKPEYYIPDESWWPKEYYDIYKIKPWPY